MIMSDSCFWISESTIVSCLQTLHTSLSLSLAGMDPNPSHSISVSCSLASKTVHLGPCQPAYRSIIPNSPVAKFSHENFCQAACSRDFCQPRPLLSRSPNPTPQLTYFDTLYPSFVLCSRWYRPWKKMPLICHCSMTLWLSIHPLLTHKYHIHIFIISMQYAIHIHILMLHGFPSLQLGKVGQCQAIRYKSHWLPFTQRSCQNGGRRRCLLTNCGEVPWGRLFSKLVQVIPDWKNDTSIHKSKRTPWKVSLCILCNVSLIATGIPSFE